MTTIKDSVHDHIEIDGVAERLLDTPPVQRLRRINQLGTVRMVYPSANHTRFEHSLGVFHLADRALENLSIEGQQAERVRAGALLHDIGHSPYSHNIESVIYRETGKYHDEVHGLIGDGPVAEVLTDEGLNPDNVADVIAGRGELGQLVSGELDVDRMDYLVRDAHHTGVPYGTIDHERLIRELRFVDGTLVLDDGNVQTAESLLLARALMNPTVYQHHVARIAKAMLRRATERALDAGETDAETLRRMDDNSFIALLRRCEESSGYADLLDKRRLFKRSVWAELEAVPEDILDMAYYERRTLESEIADSASLDQSEVILDIPEKSSIKESTSRVLVNGDVRQLGEQSTLVSALRAAQYDQWRLGVYAPEDKSERVGEAAVRTLGLDIDGTRIRDTRPGINATLDEFTS